MHDFIYTINGPCCKQHPAGVPEVCRAELGISESDAKWNLIDGKGSPVSATGMGKKEGEAKRRRRRRLRRRWEEAAGEGGAWGDGESGEPAEDAEAEAEEEPAGLMAPDGRRLR